MTKAEQYRQEIQKNYRRKTLSNVEFVIRPIPPRVFFLLLTKLDMGNAIADPDPLSLQKYAQENIWELVEAMLPACVVEPKIVSRDVKNENELHIDELSLADATELIQEIFSTLEDMDQVTKFREQRGGLDTGSSGFTVSQAPE